jgi:hypothetical protein
MTLLYQQVHEHICQQIQQNSKVFLYHIQYNISHCVIWNMCHILPMQSVHITTNIVSSNSAQANCTQYIMWSSFSVTCGRSMVFSGYFGFLQQYKTERHDITEILWKVALNPIIPNLSTSTYKCVHSHMSANTFKNENSKVFLYHIQYNISHCVIYK